MKLKSSRLHLHRLCKNRSLSSFRGPLDNMIILWSALSIIVRQCCWEHSYQAAASVRLPTNQHNTTGPTPLIPLKPRPKPLLYSALCLSLRCFFSHLTKPIITLPWLPCRLQEYPSVPTSIRCTVFTIHLNKCCFFLGPLSAESLCLPRFGK